MADLSDGLVAYYPFDGNAKDASGNGNNGTVHGATLTEDRFGTANSAYHFDGVDDYIEKKNPSNVLNIGSQNWTISVWIKTNNLSQMVVSRYECGWDCSPDVGAEASYSLGISDAKAYFSVRSDNMYGMKDIPIVRDNNNINDGTWHYIAGILDRNVLLLTIFVDGQEKNTVSIGKLDSITDGGSPFEIGRTFIQQWGSPKGYFKGAIDDIRIYNRALSKSEVQQLYQPCQPSIDIKLNSNNRVTGDKVVINAQIKGPGGSESSCEQTQLAETVWVKLPNDAVIPLIEPFTGLTLLPGDDIDTKIFEYTFSGAEPIGSYEIGGRLLHPFSGDTISTDIEVLTFSQ